MTRMKKTHPLFKEVLGLGNRVIISNLNMDGAYGMTFFQKAGFCSLVAVPITTYKVLGILGVADKKRRRFSNDFAQLLTVIANLVGVSLTKTTIMQKALPEKTELLVAPETDIETTSKDDSVNNMDNGPETVRRRNSSTNENLEKFNKHARRMGKFREQHN